MPTENARKLTDEQKAEIVLLKDTRPTQTSTNKNIARDFDVSIGLVAHMNYETLTDSQKAIYEVKAKEHKDDIKRVRNKALNELEEAIENKTIKKEALITAYGVLYDKHRLETNQATSINENRDDPETKLLAYARLLVERERLNLAIAEDRATLRDAIERVGLPGDRSKVLELVERGEI